MTAQVEINLYVGAAFEHAAELFERTPAGAQGAPSDLSGLGFRFLLSRNGVALFEASTDSGAVLAPDPKSGVIHLMFAADALAALEPGQYEHALYPLRGADALAPIWVGPAKVRAIGATAGPAMRIIGPTIPPLRVQRQGVGSMVTPVRLARAAGEAAAGDEALGARVAALEASAPLDLVPIVEELEQLRALLAERAAAESAAAPAAMAVDDARIDELMEAWRRLGARTEALETAPVFEPETLVLISQRLTALESVRAERARVQTTGIVLRPNQKPEIADPFGCVLLAALRTAGPCLAIWIGDANDPTTWDVQIAPATATQMRETQEMLDAMIEVPRFVLLDNDGFVLAVADRRAQRSVWPEDGLKDAVEAWVPVPLEGDIEIGGRIRFGRYYRPGDTIEVKLVDGGERGGAAEGDST